jgi:glycosyltransferase involved in cell wall biosynthesis
MGIETIGFDVHPLMIERQLGLALRNGARALTELPGIRTLLHRTQPRLIHVNSYRIGLPFTLAARQAQIPTIWHLRDIPESALKRRLVQRATLLPECVVAISHAVEEALGLVDQANVRQIYNGVEIERFTTQETDGAFRQELGLDDATVLLTTIGQVIPWKGHDLLLQAFGRLPHDRALHLAIVGGTVAAPWADGRENEAYLARLQALARELDIDDRVTFTGFRRDIPAIMRDSDLYVHAARAPEPFGRVLVEAMAARKVVVAPSWGGIPEIVRVGETGYLYAPDDAEALAHTLQEALAERRCWAEMGARGLARAETCFSAASHVEQMSSLFDEVLAS